MWTGVVLALAAVVQGGHGFTMNSFFVPEAPEYGSTVVLRADYRLSRGEYINEMTWSKDDQIFMTYQQRPETYQWTPITGVNILPENSTASSVVITDVSDAASGIYTVKMEVVGPSENFNSVINSQAMTVGGEAGDSLGNRFNNRRPGAGAAGTSTFVHQQTSSSSGSFPPGGDLGNRFGGSSGASGARPRPPVPDPAQTMNTALAQAQANVQNAVNQINQIQAALGNLGGR